MSKPIRFIKWCHIDGPMIVYEDGSIRWLTLRERFLCWVGLLTFKESDPIKTKESP